MHLFDDMRGLYAVPPMDAAIMAQHQAIVDAFAGLHLTPARIDISTTVWRLARRGN